MTLAQKCLWANNQIKREEAKSEEGIPADNVWTIHVESRMVCVLEEHVVSVEESREKNIDENNFVLLLLIIRASKKSFAEVDKASDCNAEEAYRWDDDQDELFKLEVIFFFFGVFRERYNIKTITRVGHYHLGNWTTIFFLQVINAKRGDHLGEVVLFL